ncbi:mechanosensitive ion channel [Thermovibrio sp.]
MELSTAVLTQYAVIAVKAVVIAVIGWVLAVVGKNVVERIVGSIDALKKHEGLPQSAGRLTYYFVILVTTVAVLEVIGLKYVTEPFIDLLNKVAGYLPNLIGAAVILIVGTFFAKVAREFVDSLLETFQIEELGKKYGIEDLGGAIGNVVYLLIILFVAIAALNALQIEAITEPAISMLTMILNAIPRIVAAVVVFGIIFFVGKVVAGITAKIVDELNIDELAKEIGISSDKLKFEELIRYLILTFAVLLGLSQAFHYLEAEALYQLTYQFTVIAFKLVVAAVIIFAGAYLGNLFEKRTENEAIGKGVKYAFIIASIFIALPYVGVSPEIIEIVVFSVSLGVGLAFALAFGLGGKEAAAELLKKLLSSSKEK